MSTSNVESSKEEVAEGLNTESGKGIEGGLSFDPNDPRLDEDASYGWKARGRLARDLKGLTSTQNEQTVLKEDSSK